MRKRRIHKAVAHLELTAFINLIVVLVPFLLSTAVFSRMAVLDLNLPAQQNNPVEQLKGRELDLEVVLRKDSIEVNNRIGGKIADPPLKNIGGKRDLASLTDLVIRIKALFPDKTEVSVLAEPDTPYDDLVQVMDSIRSAVRPAPEGGLKTVNAELFPNVSIGDAPVSDASAKGKR